MTADPLSTISPALAYTFLLVLIRTTALLVTSPLLSHKGIPAWTKVGFAVFLALALVPLNGADLQTPPMSMGGLVEGVTRETLFGLILGLAMNMVFLGLTTAARLVGLQMGFGLGAVFDPITGTDFGAFDTFYTILVTLIFFTINGHYAVILTLAETVRAVPPGTFDPLVIEPNEAAALVAGLTVSAVRIAIPVVAALFLADLGMGFVARVMPQMNVMMVGAPLKILVGIVVIIAALPATVHLMSGVITNGLAGSSQQLLMEAR